MNDIFDILPARVWPYYDSYLFKCYNCSNSYAGPKRSGVCWLCASDELKDWWHERNSDE